MNTVVHRRRGAAHRKPLSRGRTALICAALAASILAIGVMTWGEIPENDEARAATETGGRHGAGDRAVPSTGPDEASQSAVRLHSRDNEKNLPYPARQLAYSIQRLQYLAEAGAPPDEIMEGAEAIYRLLLTYGKSAVPDVLEFLETGEDLPLAGNAGGTFDFLSLRLALIDALGRIGGAEVEQFLFGQLQKTDSPAELEALARALETLQPALYRDAILDASLTRLLNMSSEPDSNRPVETAPLFRVLQEYGDQDVAQALHRLPYWFRGYAAVALANLQDGQGIDLLASLARRGAQRRDDNRALMLLAQAAPGEPMAEQAFVALMQDGVVPLDYWPLIADVLIGDRYLQLEEPPADPSRVGSLRGSNPFAVQTIFDRHVQLIYSVNYSAVLATEDVANRLALIQRLLDEATTPAAREALWAAFDLLEASY